MLVLLPRPRDNRACGDDLSGGLRQLGEVGAALLVDEGQLVF
jgi:hypothetical protein